MRVTFEKVCIGWQMNGKCRVCGKRVSRMIRVAHTVNPWNTTSDGRPKTRSEVYVDVSAKLEQIREAGPVHQKCEAKGRRT